MPSASGGKLLMAVQTISGSDVFGPVHWSESVDGAKTWSDPQPIPGLGRRTHPDGIEEGVCDTVPQHHPPTDSVIFMGWNVYYKDGKLTRPEDQRWPVYVVRKPDGAWTPPRKLEWNDPEATRIYGSNCSQRLTLPNGDVLVPMTHAPNGQPDRGVGTVLCSFDGESLTPKDRGNTLRLSVKRGLVEPSIVEFAGRYFMTIRAEDDHGYLSSSNDGLRWDEKRPWSWDHGEALTMSTTQQHWLAHSEALHLVYTRKDSSNINVMRWRAPLFCAQFDHERMVLLRETERILIPMSGDGVNEPDTVARLGNFHPTEVNPDISIVTVGETMPARGWSGNTLQATIHWSRPNRIAPA